MKTAQKKSPIISPEMEGPMMVWPHQPLAGKEKNKWDNFVAERAAIHNNKTKEKKQKQHLKQIASL